MISDKQAAAEFSKLALEAGGILNEMAWVAQESCTPDELHKVKLAIGRVLAKMLTEILNPLYRAHPELSPEGLYTPKNKETDRK